MIHNGIMNTLVNTLTKLIIVVMVATIAASDLLHSIGISLISSLIVEIRLDLATPPILKAETCRVDPKTPGNVLTLYHILTHRHSPCVAVTAYA